ncbi:MAG: aspartate carbamoyltransferase catalytic subunit [Abditibacteriota bacterium]|nr:aspartate carbamoyltransferase catalytic subunit [Abditibacteriota bacterium]
MMKLKRKDVLGLREMERGEIEMVLDSAARFKEILARPVKKVPTLRGRSMITLFYENSTRTRTSFELAAKIMSAEAINIAVAQSSSAKGESLKDTLLTLQALSADCVVIRHPNAGAPHLAARLVDIPIINAGDGFHEHPTQGLLDLLTIREHKSTFEGLNVTIIGDLLHSRVARSAIWGLLKMGANVTLCGPHTLLPPEFAATGARLETNCDAAVEGADVIMMLRLQNERMDGVYLPGVREYSALYGLNARRLAKAKPDAIVMHPGPINRGVEIADDVADDETSRGGRTVILQQVQNGVAVRMTLLYLLLGGSEE